ncbi:MAG: hypothetical protein ACRBBW_13100 [Cellvibrionaceae bacterium]
MSLIVTPKPVEFAGAIETVSASSEEVLIAYHESDWINTVALSADQVTHYMPRPGDYLVVYEDGGSSIVPQATFEAGYLVEAIE